MRWEGQWGFLKVELSASSKTYGLESRAMEQKKGFTSYLGVRTAGACPGVVGGFYMCGLSC